MSPTYPASGPRRPVFVPVPAASLLPPQPQDPPICRALLRTRADRGRALPGRHDPEWVRLAAPPAGRRRLAAGQEPFSATRDQRGDGR